MDRDGFILANALTPGSAADATTAVELIDQVASEVVRFTADRAYDAACVYEAAASHTSESLEVAIPPRRRALAHYVPHATAPWRTRHVRRIDEIGSAAWRAESGTHQQATAETAVFRFKRLIGSRLWASGESARKAEVIVGCNILNAMLELGRPESYSVLADAPAD